MKNVLVITSSFRKNGNSNKLAESFMSGALSVGHKVERIDLSEQNISFCRGCLACQHTQKCVINDDAVAVAEKMLYADVLVFATPIYYYSVSGQLKTMLDRANPLFTSDYAFRSVYLLATAADDDHHAVEGAVKDIQGWVECFENAKLECVLFAGGVEGVGDIDGNISLDKAFELGVKIE